MVRICQAWIVFAKHLNKLKILLMNPMTLKQYYAFLGKNVRIIVRLSKVLQQQMMLHTC